MIFIVPALPTPVTTGSVSPVSLAEASRFWLQLGLVERRRGRIGAAIGAYRTALQRDPNHASAHQNLAVALLLGGDLAGARSGFRRAIELLQQQNRPDEAEALRRQAGTMVKLDGA